MHVPRELYPIERTLAERLPHLRPPQRRGLALWVLGAVLDPALEGRLRVSVVATGIVAGGGAAPR